MGPAAGDVAPGRSGGAAADAAAGPAPDATCAICLSADSTAKRGALDACAHAFCLACILLWSARMNRCPLCRATYRTITALAPPGAAATVASELSEVEVYAVEDRAAAAAAAAAAAVADEEVLDEEDPMDEVACDVCGSGDDEALLLLCVNFDRSGRACGGAAHTFCVGLGRALPADDAEPWLCESCAAPGGGSTLRRGTRRRRRASPSPQPSESPPRARRARPRERQRRGAAEADADDDDDEERELGGSAPPRLSAEALRWATAAQRQRSLAGRTAGDLQHLRALWPALQRGSVDFPLPAAAAAAATAARAGSGRARTAADAAAALPTDTRREAAVERAWRDWQHAAAIARRSAGGHRQTQAPERARAGVASSSPVAHPAPASPPIRRPPAALGLAAVLGGAASAALHSSAEEARRLAAPPASIHAPRMVAAPPPLPARGSGGRRARSGANTHPPLPPELGHLAHLRAARIAAAAAVGRGGRGDRPATSRPAAQPAGEAARAGAAAVVPPARSPARPVFVIPRRAAPAQQQ